MDNLYIWLVIAAIVIILAIVSKKVKARFSGDGLDIEAIKSDHEKTRIKKVKDKSDISVESPRGRDIDIEKVKNSKIRIKK